MKEGIEIIKEAEKYSTGFAIFSCGKTCIHGTRDMCISSIAWSLSDLKEKDNELYNEIIKDFEAIEKYKKEKNEDVQEK